MSFPHNQNEILETFTSDVKAAIEKALSAFDALDVPEYYAQEHLRKLLQPRMVVSAAKLRGERFAHIRQQIEAGEDFRTQDWRILNFTPDGRVGVGPGMLGEASEELLFLAQCTGKRWNSEFNGSPLIAVPGDTTRNVTDRWYRLHVGVENVDEV